MTTALRAGWSAFRRIHVAALVADWRRTLLSVVGVALGVTVVLGVLVLKTETVRPFDAFGPGLTHAAANGVVQVQPDVAGRLPTDIVTRLRTQVPGAAAVVPVVAALTPVQTSGTDRGFFLLGGTCDVELLIGSFDCAARATQPRAAGAGVPLDVPEVIAQRYGLRPGDELSIPGLPKGAAHVGSTFSEFDRVKDINDGNVLLAPSPDVAATILGTPGFVTTAFVLPQPGRQIAADVDGAIDGVATAGPPAPQPPVVFISTAQTFNLTAMAGILIGFLIAINTVLLAIEDRRAVLGTVGALGARPRSLLAGLLGEGALVGVVGGLLAVPTGFLLGSHLVNTFGRNMLAGSGGTVHAHFTPALIGIAAAAGLLCGVLAMAGPARRLVREGPLASMASFGGVQRIRAVRLWTLLLGVALIAVAVALLRVFSGGSLPLDTGSNGMTLGLLGVAFATVWLAPRAAAALIAVVGRKRPDVARLLSADIRRYALLFAISSAVLALGTSLAVGSQSMQELGTAQVAAQKPDRLPEALFISAQSVLDQRQGSLSTPVLDEIRGAAAGRDVSTRWRSTISSGASSRSVIGVTPGDWYSVALYQPRGDAATVWEAVGRGDVVLSEVAAGRLGIGTGDTVKLPTVFGLKEFRVAGLLRPQIVDDSAVGDVVLVSAQEARTDWAAVCDQAAVRFGSAAEASAHRDDFVELGGGALSVLDDSHWRSVASAGIKRFFEPFTVTGYVVMVAAGLSVLNVLVLGLIQRRRERAVLRAVGVTPGQEQAVVLSEAAVLGIVVSVIGALGGIGLTYLQSLGSPVYYGIAIRWGLPVAPLVTGVAVVFVLVIAAAIYPVFHARRLEAANALREG